MHIPQLTADYQQGQDLAKGYFFQALRDPYVANNPQLSTSQIEA